MLLPRRASARGARQLTPPSPRAWHRSFNAAGLHVMLEGRDPALAVPIEALVATHAPAAGLVRLHYRFESEPWPALWRDETLLYQCDDPVDLPPVFELDLYRRVAELHHGELVLHAAGLATGGGAVLLAGPSGSGKSTLALALAAEGLGYLSDEMMIVGEDGAVMGLTRPITFAAGARVVAPVGWRVASCPILTAAGARADTTLVHPPAALRCHERLPVARLLLIRHDPEAEPGLRELGSAEALGALWAQATAQSERALRIATRLLQAHRVLALVTRELAGSVRAVRALLGP